MFEIGASHCHTSYFLVAVLEGKCSQSLYIGNGLLCTASLSKTTLNVFTLGQHTPLWFWVTGLMCNIDIDIDVHFCVQIYVLCLVIQIKHYVYYNIYDIKYCLDCNLYSIYIYLYIIQNMVYQVCG